MIVENLDITDDQKKLKIDIVNSQVKSNIDHLQGIRETHDSLFIKASILEKEKVAVHRAERGQTPRRQNPLKGTRS